MAEEIFKVERLGYLYNGVAALKDVSFSIRAAESVAILGANGSGKSTLLKLLDALIFPNSGTISFMGSPLTEDGLNGDFLRCFRERVGFVFAESDVQLFCPTVLEELEFAPLQLGLDRAEAANRAQELLKMLGIASLKDRAPYTLSTGEKKKVAIAAVLSANPDVLLMDEPTNGLDPRTQVWLYELLENLKTLNKTFIMATHDLSLIEDLTNRTIVIDESHVLSADGPTMSILKDRDLLLKANIIHEHTHRHGDVVHIHSHGPYSTHEEYD